MHRPWLLRRTQLLTPMPITAASALEFFDAFNMAAECAVAAGDLREARHLAERVRDFPFYRSEGHLATARLILVRTLSGDCNEAVALADCFREGWERAGRPRAGNLSCGAYAAATAHGLQGKDNARGEWLEIVDTLSTPGRPLSVMHFNEFFDALLLLHRGRPEEALSRLATPPEQLRSHYNGLWRPWYAALWAETAVLAGHHDAAARIDTARRMTSDNPIAAAIVERAAVIGDRDGLADVAGVLASLDCRYQWARTLVFAGGPDRSRGGDALAAMGASPMVWFADSGRTARCTT